MIEANKEIYQAQKKEAEQKGQFLKNIISETDAIKKENEKLAHFIAVTAPTINTSYLNTSSKMERILEKERMTPNQVMRGQMAVAINQGTVETNQISVGVNSLHGDYDAKVVPTLERIERLEQGCSRFKNYAEISNACESLRKRIIPSFQNRYAWCRKGSPARVWTATYDAEKRKQDEIENDSQGGFSSR